MSLRLGEKIQEMLHGQGEVIRPMPKFSENWFDAYRQIKDYEKTVPELYKYVQIGIAVEQTAIYFPIVPWQEEINSLYQNLMENVENYGKPGSNQ